VVTVLLALVSSVACYRAPVYESYTVEPPVALKDFSLVANDREFHLSDLRGKVVVVYIGYTHCPDLCPLTMSHLASAMELLPIAVRDEVRVVMVTADPARDTAQDMATYVHFFNPTFIGVSGDTEEVLSTLHGWGVSPECSTPKADGSYTVSHPATTYVLDRAGKLRLRMPSELEPEAMANDLQIIANERTQ